MSNESASVLPRYQDRRACPECGGLLERWCSATPEGHVVNTPVPIPTRGYEGKLSPGDMVTRTYDRTEGRVTSTFEQRLVRLDYYCPTCNTDLYQSQTRPWTDDLPPSAYYTPDAPHAKPSTWAASFVEKGDA